MRRETPAVVKENDKKQTVMWALSVATTLRENRTLSGQRNLRRRGKRYGWLITMSIYIYTNIYKHTFPRLLQYLLDRVRFC